MASSASFSSLFSSSSSSANSRNSSSSLSGSDNDNSKGKGAQKDPLAGKLLVADKQPALSKNTPRIPKLPQQQHSQKDSMERQMRALVISDEDLDKYNLHKLTKMMDTLDEDWDLYMLPQLQYMMVVFDDDNPTSQAGACLPLYKQT